MSEKQRLCIQQTQFSTWQENSLSLRSLQGVGSLRVPYIPHQALLPCGWYSNSTCPLCKSLTLTAPTAPQRNLPLLPQHKIFPLCEYPGLQPGGRYFLLSPKVGAEHGSVDFSPMSEGKHRYKFKFLFKLSNRDMLVSLLVELSNIFSKVNIFSSGRELSHLC